MTTCFGNSRRAEFEADFSFSALAYPDPVSGRPDNTSLALSMRSRNVCICSLSSRSGFVSMTFSWNSSAAPMSPATKVPVAIGTPSLVQRRFSAPRTNSIVTRRQYHLRGQERGRQECYRTSTRIDHRRGRPQPRPIVSAD